MTLRAMREDSAVDRPHEMSCLWMTTAHPARSAQCWGKTELQGGVMKFFVIKTAAYAGPILLTLLSIGVVTSVVPAPLAHALGVASVGGGIALVLPRCEGAAARVLLGAHRPESWERSAAGEPRAGADLRVVAAGPMAFAFGRHTLCVRRDLLASVSRSGISADELDAVLTHARAIQIAGLTRFDPLLLTLALPWRVLQGRGRGGLFATPWRHRWLIVLIAGAQNVARPEVCVFFGLLLAWSYAGPWARKASNEWMTRVGDEFAISSGSGPALATLLRRMTFDGPVQDRIERLDALQPRPTLRLVGGGGGG